MVSNSRYILKECSCGKLTRGTEFKKHVRGVPSELKATHVKVAQVICCTNCRSLFTGEGDRELNQFYMVHEHCPTGNISNPLIRSWYTTVKAEERGKKINVDLDAKEEEEEIATRELMKAFAEVHSASEDDIVVVQKECLSDISSITSDEEEKVEEKVGEEKRSSTPMKGVKLQSKKWSADMEVAKVSQTLSLNLMKAKLDSVSCSNVRHVKENEELKLKVVLLRSLKEENVALRADKKELIEKVGRQEEKDAHLKKVLEANHVMGSEMQEMTVKIANFMKTQAKAEELMRLEEQAREKVKTLKKCLGRKALEVHIPLYQNGLIDKPLVVEDLNQTVECYHDPDRGINCLHMNLTVRGELENMTFRKPVKKRVPGKIYENSFAFT